MEKRSWIQPILGWVLLAGLLVFAVNIPTGLRLVLGMMLGYALMRAYTGFAGSINRAYRGGSGKLMRAMAVMIFASAVLVAGLLMNVDITTYKLSVHPINLGLIIGGLLFGFGMSLSCCCASGVLTDIPVGTPRAVVTLLFFTIGTYLGFPFQGRAAWCKQTWIHSANFTKGVYLPDWFLNDGFNGYLGALILTGIFCLLMGAFSYWYEKKKRLAGEFTGIDSEIKQEEKHDFDWKNAKLFSRETYDHVFAHPWTLIQGALVIAVVFFLILVCTKKTWGVSTAYGIWWGKIMVNFFGASPDAVAAFAAGSKGGKAAVYLKPFFQHGSSVQNLGILLGTVVYLLQAGEFSIQFKEGLAIDKIDILLFALGGFTMGFGTRLANGCNAGAFYSPCASFSLSGWVYVIFLFSGAFIGNALVKWWNANAK